MKKILLIFVFSIACFGAFSQSKLKEIKVKKGETLYSIARSYNVSVDKLILHNPGLTKATKLKVNDVVNIPLLSSFKPVVSNSSVTSSSAPSSPYPIPQIDTTDDIRVTERIGKNNVAIRKHVIKPKETLYSLSKYYGITVDDLRKINPEMDQPKAGYELIVQKEILSQDSKNESVTKVDNQKAASKVNDHSQKETKTDAKTSKPYFAKNKTETKVIAKETAKEDSKVQIEPIKNSSEINAEVKVVKPLLPVANVKPDEYEEFYKSYEKDGFKISCMRGKASLVSSKESPLEAFYSNAQEGTLIKVKNMLTHQTVVLKVIGTISDAEIKSGVILKMSKEAAETIGAKEGQLLIEVNSFKYM